MTDEKRELKLTDPFPFHEIEYRIGASTQDGSRSMIVFYTNKDAVSQRLDDVTAQYGGRWWETYPPAERPDEKHVVCHLTVEYPDGDGGLRAITHVDVGEMNDGPGAADGWKAAYSDSFKRAAAKHGVGRYLRDLGETWVPTEQQTRGNKTRVVQTDATYRAARQFYVDAVGVGAGSDRAREQSPASEDPPPAAERPGHGLRPGNGVAPAAPAANGHKPMTPTAFWKATNAAGYKAPEVLALARELGLTCSPTVQPADYARLLDEIRQRKGVAA